MTYVIVKRNLVESLLDIELKEPDLMAYFYEDDIHCFAETIFLGKERSLFVFELLLFLAVDYLSYNYVLAATVVYLVNQVRHSFTIYGLV